MNKIATKVVKTKSGGLAAFYGVFYCFGRIIEKKTAQPRIAAGDSAVTNTSIKTDIPSVTTAAIKKTGIFGCFIKRYKMPIMPLIMKAIKRQFSIGSLPKNSGNFNATRGSIKNETAKISAYPIRTEAI